MTPIYVYNHDHDGDRVSAATPIQQQPQQSQQPISQAPATTPEVLSQDSADETADITDALKTGPVYTINEFLNKEEVALDMDEPIVPPVEPETTVDPVPEKNDDDVKIYTPGETIVAPLDTPGEFIKGSDVLSILKRKLVFLSALKISSNVAAYNARKVSLPLTQEEFATLKVWLNS